MHKLRRAYRFLQDKYALLSAKKYTTLAGTLVFFFIMSIVPLSFWLSLLIGKLPLRAERIFSLGVFQAVKNVFLHLQQEAQNATSGVTVVLLVTTLYSSTNLFYQMRRSGEIVYGYTRTRSGWRLRVGALALTGIVMLMCIVFFTLLAIGSIVFSRFFSPVWERIADYILLIALSFCLVLLLNAYVCPYKRPLKTFVKGTLLTVATWALAVTGFAVYLQISNLSRLYGALSAIIVFLLWLYVLMVCFIAGVIFNSEEVVAKPKRKSKSARKAHKRTA